MANHDLSPLYLKTTAIGSLPHPNMDAALQWSMRLDIPFLPQLPLRNPWEFMIPQALESLPGLEVSNEGEVNLNPVLWERHKDAFNKKLDQWEKLGDFEFSAAVSSMWLPFLYDIQEEPKPRVAKVQIAGPLTTEWVLTRKTTLHQDLPGLSSQIFRLILSKARSMVRQLKEAGVQPLIFIDEPGLYLFNKQVPSHLYKMEELKILIKTLQKDGAWVGVHCCSNTDWSQVLRTGIDVLSLDTEHSFSSLLEVFDREPALQKDFLESKKILSLGIIPTLNPIESRTARLQKILPPSGNLRDWIAKTSLFTPACGLALTPNEQTETVLALLQK